MVYILIHGLGQDKTSWTQVESLLLQQKIKVREVSLYQLLQNQDFTYENLLITIAKADKLMALEATVERINDKQEKDQA